MSGKVKGDLDIFNENTISLANKMFLQDEETYPNETKTEFVNSLRKGWLTRQYFSRGMHDLVLPAWLLGILGPNGEGRHAIAGTPILKNSDLRSYYALGSPESQEEPVIDHRGGIIPLPGSYTLIFGTIINERPFFASEVGQVNVELHDEGFPLVTVYWELDDGDTMVYDAYADKDDNETEVLIISVVRGFSDHQLLVTLCPIDQDGITEIPSISYDNKILQVTPENAPKILISEQPIRTVVIPVIDGHAGRLINNSNSTSNSASCSAKLTSWASAFPVRANPTLAIQLSKDHELIEIPDIDIDDVEEKWEDEMENIPIVKTSSKEADMMYRTSATVLRLLADLETSEITVGPSLQEEVWLPALCFQTKALDRLGFGDSVARAILDKAHSKIDTNGVVAPAKQWDAQGAMVLALAYHYYYTNDVDWVGEKFSGIKRITDWIIRQRKRKEAEDPEFPFLKGLLPRGNLSWFDPIYWKNEFIFPNNFWSLGAIDLAMNVASHLGKHGEVEKFEIDLEKFKQDLDDSISYAHKSDYLPVGPFLRDSAGMVFNLHAYYPLRLYLPEYQPLSNTVNWLVENYSHNGGLLIDQPWNAYGTYLSILLAQACRYVHRNQDVYSIINFMIDNITNQQGWAEGISPLSRRGAVGDSPNGFAAAEWINLILDLFAEQTKDDPPIFLKGIPVEWLRNGVSAKKLRLHFGASLNISAKLVDNVLTIDWKYDSPNNDKLPHVAIPYALKELPKNCVQISSMELILPSNAGNIDIQLDTKM